MKISKDDVKKLFSNDDDFLGPNDDWEGFDIKKDDGAMDGEVKELPDTSEPVKIKKIDKKIENEITIKKVRKKIAKTAEKKEGVSWSQIVESFFKLLAFIGISAFLVFVILNIPSYFSQLKWLYYTEYLGERMPGTKNSNTPLAKISPTPLANKTKTQAANTVWPQTSPVTSAPVDTQSILRIDKTNVKTPIIWNVEESKIIDNLSGGVVHYDGTSLPGQGGNVFIVGHSSNYPWNQNDYNHVFSLLDKLVSGDRISLNYADKTYSYEVVEKKVVSPSNVEVLNSTNREILSLMTCWPVGTTLNRLIIISKLVQTS